MEQLGHNIAGLSERLERLERGGVSENLKDAVKALHLGLSRLAEQINSTASNSTTQLAQVTSNLEKLAGHVGQIWEDADNAAQLLERRIDISEQELGQRISNAERAIEARVSAAEKIAQFNGNALDHALEKIEATAGQHAADQAESQRRATQHEESLHRLEESIARVESLLPGPELDERLGGVERSVQDLTDRFERSDPAERFDAAMQALSHRLEKVETAEPAAAALEAPLQAITNRLEKLEAEPAAAALEAPLQAISERLEKLETAPPALEKFEAPLQALSHRLEKLEKDHAELLAELHTKSPEPPEPASSSASLPSAFAAQNFAEQPPEHQPFELPAHEPPPYEPPPVAFSTDEEIDSPTPLPDFVFGPQTHPDTPQAEAFTPDFDDVFEEAPRVEPSFGERAFEDSGAEPENFLAQARRSARAASEEAESEDRGRLSAFRPRAERTGSRGKRKTALSDPNSGRLAGVGGGSRGSGAEPACTNTGAFTRAQAGQRGQPSPDPGADGTQWQSESVCAPSSG